MRTSTRDYPVHRDYRLPADDFVRAGDEMGLSSNDDNNLECGLVMLLRVPLRISATRQTTPSASTSHMPATV